jgi:hypothetical protein
MRTFAKSWEATHDQICSACGKQFKSKKKVATYCTSVCKVRAYRERQKACDVVEKAEPKGQTVTRVSRGGEVFYVACDFRKALSIYGEKFSYREVANYLRGPK